MQSRVMQRSRSVIAGLIALSLMQQSHAAAEDLVATAFDKVTGVPFASTMLGIVRSGEQSSQSPAALDARLKAVETMLTSINARLQAVEKQVNQLQVVVVKSDNLHRLQSLKDKRDALFQINEELKGRPSDPNDQRRLEVAARTIADEIRDSVAFDLWMLSDIDTSTHLIRTRFFVYPAFELYAIALTTWFSAIELRSGNKPQRVIAESSAFLAGHAAFLTARNGFREFTDAPAMLPEYLRTAAYCRLEAVDTYSKPGGVCEFASVCIDTMAEKREETGRLKLMMSTGSTGSLCTYNPNQIGSLKGEDELRDAYGAQLMATLADALTRLSTAGSMRDPFVGVFAHSIESQIFASGLDAPVLAPRSAVPGALPGIPRCLPLAGGCSYGAKLSKDTAWTIAETEPVATGMRTIRHNGSLLCLDIKGGVDATGAAVMLFPCNNSDSQAWRQKAGANGRYALQAGNGPMCVTAEAPAQPAGNKAFALAGDRRLFLQTCDGRLLQQFSPADSQVPAPH